ncbi:MAG: DUF4923 family protein [Bacteroidaceae bacterium]|nr:DUF4923 family protein [Bacteroidaceae bacterium]
MKKNYSLAILIGMAIMMSGCTGTTKNTGLGQSIGTTGNMSSTTTSTGSSILGTLMTSLLGNTTNKNTLVGTWTYAAPKVAFESENILAKIGSSVASSKIESTLDAQLKKMGFQAGKTTLTLNNDGTCQMVRNGKTLTGTYVYTPSTGQMTIQGALGVTKVTLYVSVVGSEMYMLFDADKLLGMMNTLTSVSSKTNTLSSLLANYNGLKLGWTMTKR